MTYDPATDVRAAGSTAVPPQADGVHDTAPGADRSIGDIVGDIARDLSALVKQELDLAKVEAKEQATRAGKGAGLLGGAGVAGHLVLVFASLALMFMLDTWMHTGWAALVVAAVWGLVAAVLAQRGRKELKRVDPALTTTQQTLKDDVQWAKEQRSS